MPPGGLSCTHTSVQGVPWVLVGPAVGGQKAGMCPWRQSWLQSLQVLPQSLTAPHYHRSWFCLYCRHPTSYLVDEAQPVSLTSVWRCLRPMAPSGLLKALRGVGGVPWPSGHQAQRRRSCGGSPGHSGWAVGFSCPCPPDLQSLIGGQALSAVALNTTLCFSQGCPLCVAPAWCPWPCPPQP